MARRTSHGQTARVTRLLRLPPLPQALAYGAVGVVLFVTIVVVPAVGAFSRDLLATEIVRTLVGSMGIVAAVPITTGIAALLAAAVGPDGDEARGAR